jgi:hypothetical protein
MTDLERSKVLLKAVLSLLQKAKDSDYVIDILSETIFYDGTDCDGYCLYDDIEALLEDE